MQKRALKEGKLEWSGVTNMERKQQVRHCKEVVQELGDCTPKRNCRSEESRAQQPRAQMEETHAKVIGHLA